MHSFQITPKLQFIFKRFFYVIVVFFMSLSLHAEVGFKPEFLWPKIAQTGWYFNFPSSIAVDSSGLVYVSDTYTNRIKVFSPDGEMIRSWGSFGNKAGQFNAPYGLAVSASGNVYVVDKNNHRVQIFTSTGKLVNSWGEPGSANGQFIGPSYIALDNNGQVYVTDTGNNRVQQFSASGQYIKQWQVSSPQGIVVNQDGLVFIVEEQLNRIAVFDLNGQILKRFGSRGKSPGQFVSPQGLAIDNKGKIYVADQLNNRIQVFDAEGQFIRTWGGPDYVGKGFSRPFAVAIAPKGTVYVADTGNNRIQRYKQDGSYVSSWQSQGAIPGYFSVPAVVLSPDRLLYVTDSFNDRIQIFSLQGDFIRSWGERGSDDGEFMSISGLAFDNQGLVYVSDLENNRIRVFDNQGKFIRRWGEFGKNNGQFNLPNGISIGPDQLLYVADRDNHRIQVFSLTGKWLKSWGSFGTNSGQFNKPVATAIDKQGNIYVADALNYRIQVFDPEGKFIRQWGQQGPRNGDFGLVLGITFSPEGLVYIADATNNRIQIFRPDGEFVDTFGQAGDLLGQFAQPNSVAFGDKNTLFISEAAQNRIQRFSLNTANKPINKAIILAGGGPDTDDYTNPLWDSTEKLANKAWQSLTAMGFSKTDIRYLTAGNTEIDFDNNGVYDDLIPATRHSLQKSISELTDANAGNILLYLIDHGGPGKFQINSKEYLNAEDLEIWLKPLENQYQGKLTVIIEACNSASFFSKIAKSGRNLLASANVEQPAVISNGGLNSFSYYFWSEIRFGSKLVDAFKIARQAMSSQLVEGNPQNAQLDSNGDGLFSAKDYDSLGNFCISDCASNLVSPMSLRITDVSEGKELQGETQAEFSMQVISKESLVKAWVQIQRPDDVHKDNNEPVKDALIIELECDSLGLCQGEYDKFDVAGKYQVTFYAQDAKLQLVQSTIARTFTKGSLNTQATYQEADGKLLIADVFAIDDHYQVILQDTGHYVFELVSASKLTSTMTTTNSFANYDNSSLLLTIPEVSALGKRYRVILKNTGGYKFELVSAIPI